jgi:hypothetical protein
MLIFQSLSSVKITLIYQRFKSEGRKENKLSSQLKNPKTNYQKISFGKSFTFNGLKGSSFKKH